MKISKVHYVGPLYYWLTERGRRKFWEPKLWGSLGKPKHWKKNFNFFFFSINFTQIFRICPKMFQFLKYLLHKQIIEMCHSQNLRRPLSVPCPTQCTRTQFKETLKKVSPFCKASWPEKFHYKCIFPWEACLVKRTKVNRNTRSLALTKAVLDRLYIIVTYKNIEKTGQEQLGNDLKEELSNVAENKQKVQAYNSARRSQREE